MTGGDVCFTAAALALVGVVLTPLITCIVFLFKMGEARQASELASWKALYYEAKGVSQEGVSTIREIVRIGK